MRLDSSSGASSCTTDGQERGKSSSGPGKRNAGPGLGLGTGDRCFPRLPPGLFAKLFFTNHDVPIAFESKIMTLNQ